MGDQVKILGLPAWPVGSTATLGGGESSDLPASNVLDTEPTKISRCESTDPRYTQWNIRVPITDGPGLYETKDVGGIAVINHSIKSGQYRFIGTTEDGASSGANYAPTSIPSSSGFTGAVTDIDDDPVSSDGLTATLGTGHVRVRFTNPASALKLGANRQCFVVRVSEGVSSTATELTAELYENGVLKGGLGTVVIGGPGNPTQTVWWSWDASLLSSASATNIEVRLVAIDPYGAGPLVTIYGMSFRAALANESVEFDSGWRDVPEYSETDDGTTPTRSLHYFPDTPWVGVAHVVAMFRVPTGLTVLEVTSGATPNLYVDIGRILLGTTFTPQYGLKQNSIRTNVGVQQHSGSAMAGQAYSADAFRYRMADFTLILTRSERDTLVNSLDWRKGLSSPFYIALEPSLDLSYQQFTAFYCVVDKAGQSEQIPMEFSTSQRYYKSYTVKERL